MDGQLYASGLPVGIVTLPPDPTSAAAAAAAQSAASFPNVGLCMAMDSSTAMLMPGSTAQSGSLTAQQLQQPAAPSAIFTNTVFSIPLGNHPDSSNACTAPCAVPSPVPLLLTSSAEGALGPKLEPGLGYSAAASAGNKEAVAGVLANLDVKPPADPNDPEVVAAALSARITAAGATIIFEKSLTASDVSGGGRVVVPKSVAEQYFPKLEQPSGVTISATDLDGRSYMFKWRFWVNNSSRMYLLEGAGELHRNYGLEVGDVMVFAQKPDGSLVVAGRVANKSDLVKRPPAKRPAAHGGGGAGGAGSGARGGRDVKTSRVPQRLQQQHLTPDGAAAAPGGPAALTAAGGGLAGREGAGSGVAGTAAAAAAALGAENAAAMAARGRKRKAATAPPPGAVVPRVSRGRVDEGVSLAVLDMEAPSDGIFRAVVLQHVAPVPLGVALARNNRWTATLDVAGELYQAYFDTRDDAVEALTAAGASP